MNKMMTMRRITNHKKRRVKRKDLIRLRMIKLNKRIINNKIMKMKKMKMMKAKMMTSSHTRLINNRNHRSHLLNTSLSVEPQTPNQNQLRHHQ
jgi:hypothetical protein